MAKGDPMPYRVQRVLCRLCNEILVYGEGVEQHEIMLFGGTHEWCNCGVVELWPFEPDPERIQVERPHTMDIVEDKSVLWEDAMPPENDLEVLAKFRWNGKPLRYRGHQGPAPWDGTCSECLERIHEGSTFFRLEVIGRYDHWLHPECVQKNTVREEDAP